MEATVDVRMRLTEDEALLKLEAEATRRST